MIRALLAALCSIPLLGLAQEPPCLKEVFNRYCLGGPIAPVLEAGEPVFKQDRGAGTTYYAFKDGAGEALRGGEGLRGRGAGAAGQGEGGRLPRRQGPVADEGVLPPA